ncbi:uncharacterized [Tachysurus ichikawai]
MNTPVIPLSPCKLTKPGVAKAKKKKDSVADLSSMATGLIFVSHCFKAWLCLPRLLEHGWRVKLNLPNSAALAFLYERHKTDVFCLARKQPSSRD